jgi:hypothetical protein
MLRIDLDLLLKQANRQNSRSPCCTIAKAVASVKRSDPAFYAEQVEGTAALFSNYPTASHRLLEQFWPPLGSLLLGH